MGSSYKYPGPKKKKSSSQLHCLALARAARLEKLNRRSAGNEVPTGPPQNDEDAVIAPINQPNHDGAVGGVAEEVQTQNQENIAARVEPQDNNGDSGNKDTNVAIHPASPPLPNVDIEAEHGAFDNPAPAHDEDNLTLITEPPRLHGRIKLEPLSPEQNTEDDPRMLRPGTISTQPDRKIIFTTPYNVVRTNYIEIKNTSNRRIGFQLKCRQICFTLNQKSGSLNPGEAVLIELKTVKFEIEEAFTERVAIEWMNMPETKEEVLEEYLDGDGCRMRKNMVVEFMK